MSMILFHLAVCIGLCMLWEGVLPLFFTKRWQQVYNFWSSTDEQNVQRFALKLVLIGVILMVGAFTVMYGV